MVSPVHRIAHESEHMHTHTWSCCATALAVSSAGVAAGWLGCTPACRAACQAYHEVSHDAIQRACVDTYLGMGLVRVCWGDGRGDIILACSGHLADSIGDANVELTALLRGGYWLQ